MAKGYNYTTQSLYLNTSTHIHGYYYTIIILGLMSVNFCLQIMIPSIHLYVTLLFLYQCLIGMHPVQFSTEQILPGFP